MPRRVRNYAEEYARRLQLEQERATRTDRPFDRAKARGHLNPHYERAQVRERQQRKKQPSAGPPVDKLSYWIRKTAFGIPLGDYESLVEEAIDRLADDDDELSERKARTWMVARLRQKYADTLEFLARVQSGMTFRQAADGPPQSQGQRHYFLGRVEYVGVEVYWYHGNR